MDNAISELTERLLRFRDERDWRRFHSLRNLVSSVAIEAGELLELTQWLADDDIERRLADPAFRDRLADETADVFLYLLLVCEHAGIDLAAAAAAKIDRNGVRYPVEKARGNARKHIEF